MTSREKFEAWMTAEQWFHGSDFEWDERRNCYAQFGIHLAYKAFMAAEGAAEQKLTDMAVQLANADSKCRELAVENGGLKAICDDRRMFIMNGVQLGYIQVPTVETDPALETIRVAVSPQEPTPATDAFLAEVRAQGVDMFALMFAEEAIKSNNITTGWRAKASRAASEYAEALREDAAQLRKGAAL